jgi:sugar phosphate isomerase/epimerase
VPTSGQRPITVFTGQWADRPIAEVVERAAAWGYDGLELACWGDHFDIPRALHDDEYVDDLQTLLERHGLTVWALGNHLVSHAVCDHPIDRRHEAILPPRVWGDGDPEGVRRRAAEDVKDAARAAARLGASTVVGFTGSSIWHTVAGFPPLPEDMVDSGFADFAERWGPIIDVFEAEGVQFAAEVTPSQLAYDYWTTKRALEAINHRPGFGINYDPGHLHWQFVDPVSFLLDFGDRIYHVHAKECVRHLDGRNGILSSHLQHGDMRRGWDFRALGHGDLDWTNLVRALDAIDYRGPLSVEWDDAGYARDRAAAEGLALLRRLNLNPVGREFQDAFGREGATT